jgi:hypothetical protein
MRKNKKTTVFTVVFLWCPREDSNLRPPLYESIALPLSYSGWRGQEGMLGVMADKPLSVAFLDGWALMEEVRG